MNTAEQLLDAHFLSDFDRDYDYHQDYRDPYSAFVNVASYLVPFGLFISALIYHAFYTLDFNLLPLHQLLWNALVYLTPVRLLESIDEYQRPTTFTNPELRPKTFAAKSETMRRILGIDRPGGIFNTVAEVGKKGLSSLPVVGIPTQDTSRRPPGLGNWDNSCYQNSVLQGLSSLTTISEYLTIPWKQSEVREASDLSGSGTTSALQGLVESLNDPSNNGRRIWTPTALKSMSSWQQQDAQEYYSKVLDEIDKEIGKALVRTKVAKGLESDDLDIQRPVSQASEDESTPITRNPLEGLIAQRVGCTRCGFSDGLSMIPFNCLTVPLGRAWEHDIFECLDEYTKLEQIEGVECAKCTLLKHQRLLTTLSERMKEAPEDSQLRITTFKRLEAVNLALEEEDFDDKTLSQKCGVQPNSRVSTTKSRQAVIARPPRSLVVHINRSVFDELTGELKKNYSDVRFPMTLDLGPWCLGSLESIRNPDAEEWLLNPETPMVASSREPSRQTGPLYELRSVVTHYGRHENGHYVSYKSTKYTKPADSEDEDGERQWWGLSDDDVMPATEEDVLRQGGVFMLFYDSVDQSSTLTSKYTEEIPEANLPPQVEMLADVALAASIPLPPIDDTDLSESDDQSSISTAESEKTVTNPSEVDEDEDAQLEQSAYEPTKAIIIPPYMASTGRRVEGKEGQQKRHIPSSLVMV